MTEQSKDATPAAQSDNENWEGNKKKKKAQTLRPLTSYLSLCTSSQVPTLAQCGGIFHQIHFIMPYRPEGEKKGIPPRTPHFIISK